MEGQDTWKGKTRGGARHVEGQDTWRGKTRGRARHMEGQDTWRGKTRGGARTVPCQAAPEGGGRMRSAGARAYKIPAAGQSEVGVERRSVVRGGVVLAGGAVGL